MGTARAVFAAVGATALSGCMWAMPGANVDRTAHNGLETAITPATVGDLEVMWTATADAHGVLDPVVSADGVFVTTHDDMALYGFDPASGERLWKRAETDGTTYSQPSLVGDAVVAGRLRPGYEDVHDTVTLDPATGADLASVPGGRPDGQRGKRELVVETWTKMIQTPVGPRPYPQANLVSRDAGDPSFGWRGHVSAYPERTMTLGTDFAYDAGYGVGNGVALRAYALDTQPAACPNPSPFDPAVCPSWSVPMAAAGDATRPVLANGGEVVYVGSAYGDLYAINGLTGAIIWQEEIGPGIGAPPALADGVLYVPAYGPTLSDGKLVAVNAATGSELWSVPLSGPPTRHQPAVAGGVVFVPDAPGTIRAYDAADGDLLWTGEVGGDTLVSGAPAVANGKLFVGTQDGRVVAFGTSLSG